MTSEGLIIPTPNRPSLRIKNSVAQSESGIVAYGSLSCIYFLNARYNPPKLLDSLYLNCVHSGKVVALSFSKCEKELLASLGEDNEIKIWDLVQKTPLATTNNAVGNITNVLEWIPGSSNLLVFPSQKRQILAKWNIQKNEIIKVKTGLDAIVSSLASCKDSPHLLAIGHCNGVILIVDIIKEKVLQKLKNHNQEICFLSWSPHLPDTLLSTSYDLSLRVWKVTELHPQYIYRSPSQRYNDKQKYADKNPKILGTFHPSEANIVILTTTKGDIAEINFTQGENAKPLLYFMRNYDASIKKPISVFTTCIEKDNKKIGLFVCMDERKVTVWNTWEKRLYSQLQYVNWFIYHVSISPVDPYLIAIGNGDGNIKIWNSHSDETKCDITSIFIHNKTKILVASWHPTNESILAYGTNEGRVGVIDLSKRRSTYSFETHHAESVYSIAWAPCRATAESAPEKEKFFIYSCGGGAIFINKENSPKSPALKFEELIQHPPDSEAPKNGFCELCWKSDFSSLCVGTFRGTVSIYNDKLELLAFFNVQIKTVECLIWHPDSTYMSPDGSPFKHWLACCGFENEIHIFDTESILEKANENMPVAPLTKLIRHKKRVVSLCWSPHSDGFLVSASKDGTALVWNVSSGSVTATYIGHSDAVLTVQWSFLDPDVIYSGSQDSTCRAWKISEQSIIDPSNSGLKKKRLKKLSPQEGLDGKVLSDSDEEEHKSPQAPKAKEAAKTLQAMLIKAQITNEGTHAVDQLLDSNANSDTLDTTLRLPVGKMGGDIVKKQYNFYNLVHVDAEEDLGDCMKLADILCEKHWEKSADSQFYFFKSSEDLVIHDPVKFCLFTENLTARKYVEMQAETLTAEGSFSVASMFSLISGNLKTFLQEAAEKKSLTSFLVSIAPHVSHAFWLEICEKFAKQLVEANWIFSAIFYFLLSNKIYDAINLLHDKGFPNDALLLARAILPEGDPIFPKLIFACRRKFSHSGGRVPEAKCMLSLNEPLAAAKVLATAHDAKHLRAAAHICKKFGLHREAGDYIFACLEKCLQQCEWPFFQSIREEWPELKVYSPLIAVHKALHHQITCLSKFEDVVIQEIFCKDNVGKRRFWQGCVAGDSKQSFVQQLVSQLLSAEFANSDDVSSLGDSLKALDDLSLNRKSSANASEAHINVAVCLTKFIILCLMGDSDVAALRVFLKMFETSHNIAFLPKILFSSLFPFNLYWCDASQKIICKSIVDNVDNNPVMLQFQNICKNFCDELSHHEIKAISSNFTKEDLDQNPLSSIVQNTRQILTEKSVGQYLLAYFASNVINEFSRLISKKNVKFACLSRNTKNFISEKSVALHKEKAEISKTEPVPNGAVETSKTEPVPNGEVETSKPEPVPNSDGVSPSKLSSETPALEKEPVSSTQDDLEALIALAMEEAERKSEALQKPENSQTCENPTAESIVDSASSLPSLAESSLANPEEILQLNQPAEATEKTNLPTDMQSSEMSQECLPSEFICVSNEKNDGSSVLLDQNMSTSENKHVDQLLLEDANSDMANTAAGQQDVGIANTAAGQQDVDNAFGMKVGGLSEPTIGQSFSSDLLVRENSKLDYRSIMKPDNSVSSSDVITAQEVGQVNNLVSPVERYTIEKFIRDCDNLLFEEKCDTFAIIESGFCTKPEGIKLSQETTDNSSTNKNIESASKTEDISSSSHKTNSSVNVENNEPCTKTEDIKLSSQEANPPTIIESKESCTKTKDHTPCLANVETFLNLISLIALNVCRDEFAMRYYLGERLKALNNLRATTELAKASMKRGSGSGVKGGKEEKVGEESMQQNNILTPPESTEECDIVLDKSQDYKCHSSVEDEQNTGHSQSLLESVPQSEKILANSEDQNAVTSSADVQLKDDSSDKKIDRNGDIMGHVNTTSEEELKDDFSDKKIDRNGDIMGNVNTTSGDSNSDTSACIVAATSASEPIVMIENSGQVATADYFPHNESSVSGDLSTKDLEINELQTGVLKVGIEVAGEVPKASLKECHDSISESLSDKCRSLLENIQILEKQSEEMPYPNPFEIVPKLIQVSCDMIKKSSCSVVQERLHQFVHEVLNWSEQFRVESLKFSCQLCEPR